MSRQPASRTNERVVVVDDHEDVLAVLAQDLALEGFDVRTTADGATALDVIAERLPLCVLTDIEMPGIDGFELARRLRSLYGPEMVLVAMTGRGDGEDGASPEFADFDQCLRKPIDLEELHRLLRP